MLVDPFFKKEANCIYWRYGYNRRLTQMVKVVIDGNRLWSSQGCQHAQGMMEHECWNTNAGTQMLEHECWNTNAETRMLEHE
jgi:hypothetical protein